MAKFQIDYFGKDMISLYGGRRLEKEFKDMKEALMWVAEKMSDKSYYFKIIQSTDREG